MPVSPDDDVIEQLDLEHLPGTDEIPGDLDVRLGRDRLTAYAACGISGVMPYPVLCRM